MTARQSPLTVSERLTETRQPTRQLLVKFSDSFLASIEKENEGSSSADDYLRYTKLDQGKPANFALLEQDPLEYWLVWGIAKENDKMKPFRFVEQPSQEDIELELGKDYVQSMNFEKTAVRKPSQCLTWPVYNWDTNRVQVLEVSHISLARQFAKYGLNKKYSRNLLDWDFELSKIKADMVKYGLLIVPRDEDEHDEAAMEKAWAAAEKAGFDLNRIVTGGDPFSEG